MKSRPNSHQATVLIHAEPQIPVHPGAAALGIAETNQHPVHPPTSPRIHQRQDFEDPRVERSGSWIAFVVALGLFGLTSALVYWIGGFRFDANGAVVAVTWLVPPATASALVLRHFQRRASSWRIATENLGVGALLSITVCTLLLVVAVLPSAPGSVSDRMLYVVLLAVGIYLALSAAFLIIGEIVGFLTRSRTEAKDRPDCGGIRERKRDASLKRTRYLKSQEENKSGFWIAFALALIALVIEVVILVALKDVMKEAHGCLMFLLALIPPAVVSAIVLRGWTPEEAAGSLAVKNLKVGMLLVAVAAVATLLTCLILGGFGAIIGALMIAFLGPIVVLATAMVFMLVGTAIGAATKQRA